MDRYCRAHITETKHAQDDTFFLFLFCAIYFLSVFMKEKFNNAIKQNIK